MSEGVRCPNRWLLHCQVRIETICPQCNAPSKTSNFPSVISKLGIFLRVFYTLHYSESLRQQSFNDERKQSSHCRRLEESTVFMETSDEKVDVMFGKYLPDVNTLLQPQALPLRSLTFPLVSGSIHKSTSPACNSYSSRSPIQSPLEPQSWGDEGGSPWTWNTIDWFYAFEFCFT